MNCHGMCQMPKLLRLKFAPGDGLSILPHPDLVNDGYHPQRFVLKDCRDLAEVEQFNVYAAEHDWPRMRGSAQGWRSEVHRALIELETDACPQHWRLSEKIDVSLMLMDLLDHDTGSVHEALEKLDTAQSRRV